MPMPQGGAMKPPGAMPGAGESATGPGKGGPTPSPMATPQPMEGVQKAARVQIQIASKMIQKELPNFPLDSPEFDAVHRALGVLNKAFGKQKDEDSRLFPAETMNILSALKDQPKAPGGPGAGAPPPGAGGPPPGAGAPSPMPA